jgi:putative oxidoreductase
MGRTIFKCWGTTTNFFQSLLLLSFRLYWGFLFFIGGIFKLANMGSFGAFFGQLGLSTGLAYIVAIFELICGILLFFGLLSRLAAACTTVIMFSAYIIAHPAQFHSFFNDPQFFFSAPSFSFLIVSLVILFFGPGLFSIDAIIKRKMITEEPPHDHPDHCCNKKCERGEHKPPEQKPPENKDGQK